VVANSLTPVQAGDRLKRSPAVPSGFPATPWRVLSFLSFFAAWWAAANPWYPLASTRVLPSPLAVAEALWLHASERALLESVGITLGRVAAAFIIAMVLGTVCGILMGRYQKFDRAADGWLMMGLNMPALIVGMMAFVWFGLNDMALIIAVVINKVPTVAVTVREGARAIDRDLVQVARAFRLSWQKTLFKVYLPQLVPFILAAARSGLALIWKIILVYELLGRSSGVGYQLHTYFSRFDIKTVLAYAFAFMAVVITIEMVVVRRIERHLTGWRL
jgi:ABC-type nitrate/sulfonate/bicarbonate transport system permease component